MVLFLFGSGLAFPLGVGVICLAMIVQWRAPAARWIRLLANVGLWIGLALTTLSAVPWPMWLYLLGGGITVAAFIMCELRRVPPTVRRVMIGLSTGVWLLCLALELPYLILPEVTALPAGSRVVSVVGDSVTAGIGEGRITTWPQLLREEHHIQIHDFSRMGATVKSALQQAEKIPAGGGIVILEIGGNDLLGTTTSDEFETHLERLLAQVSAPNRQTLMFELPLPPTYNRFGEIQRRLARRHQVQLIPRYVLMSVLTGRDATLDSIHLSQSGHNQMARTVWNIISPAWAWPM